MVTPDGRSLRRAAEYSATVATQEASLWHTEPMRATFFEFFYGTRTPAPVVV